jgi:N-acyl homoserine lactone hydrolase
MRIHAIKAGSLDVKTSFYAGKGKTRAARMTSMLLDRTFKNIPVYSWAIEHPEGIIVIDTGLTSRMRSSSFFPLIQRPYWTSQFRFNITPDEEIGPQLIRRGISPNDVRWVIITHSHFDHTQALYHFPNSEIVFSRADYDAVQAFRLMRFDFPSKWPKGMKIRKIEYMNAPVGPFEQSYPFTRAGDVRLIPTPGHTLTHQSVVLRDGGMTYFFAGDASYDLPSLLDGTIDASAMNSNVVLETRKRILKYAATTPLIYMSTHDAGNETRLANRTPLFETVQTTQQQPIGAW